MEVPKQMVEHLDKALQGLQRKAADKQDTVALHLLDAIFGYQEPNDPERLGLIMILQGRLQGNGNMVGNVVCNALTQLMMLTGFRI